MRDIGDRFDRGTIMHTLHAVAIATMLLAGTSTGVLAQPEGCGAALRDAPIETVQLPEGWEWETLLLEPQGMPYWFFSIQDPSAGSASGAISCTDDAAGLFVRRDEVDRAVGVPSRHAIPIGSGDPEIDATVAAEVILIGDASRATHDALWDYTTLQWRKADFVGEIRASGGLDFADVEAMALALDALLPGD